MSADSGAAPLLVDIVSPDAMENFGARLASLVQPGFMILLSGELGSGKTTLVRGFVRARGHTGIVKSPTFTLVEPYQLASGDIYHMDLYRLASAAELEAIAIRDYLDGQAICLVEWPERAGDRLAQSDLRIEFQLRGQARQLMLWPGTEMGMAAVTQLGSG